MRTPRTGGRGIATILLTAAIAVAGCSTAPPDPGTAPVGAGGVEYLHTLPGDGRLEA